jgi:peptidoglycan/xylan/chitin deacetylase (PgdA/CDA1 family)
MKTTAQALLPSSILVARGPSTRKRIALTFDDGPGPLTHDYLATLARYEAKATFFVLGGRCVQYRSQLERIVQAGHEVAAHGYSHQTFSTLSREELQTELRETARLLPPERRPLVRPPRGDLSLGALRTCIFAKYTVALWSFDTEDWRHRSEERVVEAFERGRREGRVRAGAIVLLHDDQRWTLNALPRILESLRKDGYELVTVGSLLGR